MADFDSQGRTQRARCATCQAAHGKRRGLRFTKAGRFAPRTHHVGVPGGLFAHEGGAHHSGRGRTQLDLHGRSAIRLESVAAVGTAHLRSACQQAWKSRDFGGVAATIETLVQRRRGEMVLNQHEVQTVADVGGVSKAARRGTFLPVVSQYRILGRAGLSVDLVSSGAENAGPSET